MDAAELTNVEMSWKRTGQNPGMFSVSLALLQCGFGWITRVTALRIFGAVRVQAISLCIFRACASHGITMYSVSQPFLTQVSCAHVVVMILGNSLIFHWLLCIATCRWHAHWHRESHSLCEDDSFDTHNFATPLESDDDVSETGFCLRDRLLGCVQKKSSNAVWVNSASATCARSSVVMDLLGAHEPVASALFLG